MKKIHTKHTNEHKTAKNSYITVNRSFKNSSFTTCNAVIDSKFHTQTTVENKPHPNKQSQVLQAK